MTRGPRNQRGRMPSAWLTASGCPAEDLLDPFDVIPQMLELYRSGQLKLDELITARYRLEDIAQGYRDMHEGRNLRGIIVYDH